MTLVSHLDWNGDIVDARRKEGAIKGLKLAAEHVLTETNKVVPLEEDTLMRSGTPSVDSTSMTAAVSYDTPYAVRQHEELTYRHAPGRKAKYLEETMAEQDENWRAIVAAAIRRALE